MFEEIYRKLKDKGFNVYSIGQQSGDFENGYVVIVEYGDIESSHKLGVKGRVDLMCFYPFGSYSKVNNFKEKIIDAMYEMRGYRMAYEPTQITVDDSKTAYQFKLSFYKNKIKKEGRY